MSETRNRRDPLMAEPGSLLDHSQPGRIVMWDPPIDPDVLARVRAELAFAERKKYLAVPIDIADLKALLAAVDVTVNFDQRDATDTAYVLLGGLSVFAQDAAALSSSRQPTDG